MFTVAGLKCDPHSDNVD